MKYLKLELIFQKCKKGSGFQMMQYLALPSELLVMDYILSCPCALASANGTDFPNSF